MTRLFKSTILIVLFSLELLANPNPQWIEGDDGVVSLEFSESASIQSAAAGTGSAMTWEQMIVVHYERIWELASTLESNGVVWEKIDPNQTDSYVEVNVFSYNPDDPNGIGEEVYFLRSTNPSANDNDYQSGISPVFAEVDLFSVKSDNLKMRSKHASVYHDLGSTYGWWHMFSLEGHTDPLFWDEPRPVIIQLAAKNARVKKLSLPGIDEKWVNEFFYNSFNSSGNGSYQFAIIGNYGCAGENEEAVADLVKSWNSDYIVTTGNNSYRDEVCGAAIQLNVGTYYNDYIKSLGSSINRFFPALGEEEYKDENENFDQNSITEWQNYFDLPSIRYYDFEWDNVHYFVLNTLEGANSFEPIADENSDMAQWLKNGLESSAKPFQVVVGHHSPYSSSNEKPALRWPFKEWGADAVITSGANFYERWDIDGLPYIVNGLGGYARDVQTVPSSSSDLHSHYSGKFGALKISKTGSQALWLQFINTSNELIDEIFLFPGDINHTKVNGEIIVREKNYFEIEHGGTLASTEPLDLYLIIGESNAASRCPESSSEGRCFIEPQDKEATGVYVYNNTGEFEKLINPTNKYSTVGGFPTNQTAGFGFAFASAIHDLTGNNIGVISNARGGTSITEWQKDYDHTETSYDQYSSYYGGNNLYTEALNRLTDALTNYPNAQLKGILWQQGESDVAAVNSQQLDYSTELQTLFSSLESDLNSVPVLIAQVSHNNVQGTYTHENINQQIFDYSVSDSDAWVVKTNELDTYDPVKVHFTYDAYRELGNRFARIALKNIYQKDIQLSVNGGTPISLFSDSFSGTPLQLTLGDVIEIKVKGLTDTQNPPKINLNGLGEAWIARFGGEVKYFCTPSVNPDDYRPFLGYDSQIHGVAFRKYPSGFQPKYDNWEFNSSDQSWNWSWTAARQMDASNTEPEYVSHYQWKKAKDLEALGKPSKYWPEWNDTSVKFQRDNQKEGINMELLRAWNGKQWNNETQYTKYTASDIYDKYVLSLDDDEVVYLNYKYYDPEIKNDNPVLLRQPRNLWKLAPDQDFWNIIDPSVSPEVVESREAINDVITAYQKNRTWYNNGLTEDNGDPASVPRYEGYELEDSQTIFALENTNQNSGEECIEGRDCIFLPDGIPGGTSPAHIKAPGKGSLSLGSFSCDWTMNVVSPLNTDTFYGAIKGTRWPSVGEEKVPYTLTGLEGLSSEQLNGFILALEYEDALGYLSTDTRYLKDKQISNGAWTELFDFTKAGYYSISAYYKRCDTCDSVLVAGQELMEVDLRFVAVPGKNYSSFTTSGPPPGMDLAEGRGQGAYWFLRDFNASSPFLTPSYGYHGDGFLRTYTFTVDSTVTFGALDSDPYTFWDYADQWYLSERYQSKKIPDDSLAKYLKWNIALVELEDYSRGGGYDEINEPDDSDEPIASGEGKLFTHQWSEPGTFKLVVTYRETRQIAVLVRVVDYSYEKNNPDDFTKGRIESYDVSPDQEKWLGLENPENYKVAHVTDILSQWKYVDGPQNSGVADWRFDRFGKYQDEYAWYSDNEAKDQIDEVTAFLDGYEAQRLMWFPDNWIRHCSPYPSEGTPEGISASSLISDNYNAYSDAITSLFTNTDEEWQVRLPWTAYTQYNGYLTRTNIKAIIDLEKFWNNATGAFSGVGNSRFTSKEDYQTALKKYPFVFTDEEKAKYDFYLDLLWGRKFIFQASDNNLTVKNVERNDNNETSKEYFIASWHKPVSREEIREDFLLGADISSVSALTAQGVRFKEDPNDSGLDDSGLDESLRATGNLLDLMMDYGGNVVRLHLWNSPKYNDNINLNQNTIPAIGDDYPFNNYDDTREQILMAKGKGLKVLLDIMYSDDWANPERQVIPEEWMNEIEPLSGFVEDVNSEKFSTLQQKVYDYTLQVLTDLNNSGALPDYVQLFNESPQQILLPRRIDDYCDIDKVIQDYCAGNSDPNCEEKGLGENWRLKWNAEIKDEYRDAVWKLIGFDNSDEGRALPLQCSDSSYPNSIHYLDNYNMNSLECISSKQQLRQKHLGWVNWDRNAAIFNKALDAVEAFEATSGKDVKVLLQHNKIDQVNWWLEQLSTSGAKGRIGSEVVDLNRLDMMGVSYYKTYSANVSISDVREMIETTYDNHKLPVAIVETAYPFTLENDDEQSNLVYWDVDQPNLQDFTYLCKDQLLEQEQNQEPNPGCDIITPESQRKWLKDLRDNVYQARGGQGVFVWEPFWVACDDCQMMENKGSTVDNQAFFDFENGNYLATEAMEFFCLNGCESSGPKPPDNGHQFVIKGVNYSLDTLMNGTVFGENKVTGFDDSCHPVFTGLKSDLLNGGKQYLKIWADDNTGSVTSLDFLSSPDNISELEMIGTVIDGGDYLGVHPAIEDEYSLIKSLNFNGMAANSFGSYAWNHSAIANFDENMVIDASHVQQDPSLGYLFDDGIVVGHNNIRPIFEINDLAKIQYQSGTDWIDYPFYHYPGENPPGQGMAPGQIDDYYFDFTNGPVRFQITTYLDEFKRPVRDSYPNRSEYIREWSLYVSATPGGDPGLLAKLKAEDVLGSESQTGSLRLYSLNLHTPITTTEPLVLSNTDKDGPFLLTYGKPTIKIPEINNLNNKIHSGASEGKFLVSAHRGYGTPYSNLSVNPDIDLVEIDLQRTRDGKIIIIHDDVPMRETEFGTTGKDIIDMDEVLSLLDGVPLEKWPEYYDKPGIEFESGAPLTKIADIYWEEDAGFAPQYDGLKNAFLRDLDGTIYVDENNNNEKMKIQTIEDAITWAKNNNIFLSIDKAFDKNLAFDVYRVALDNDWEDNISFKGRSNWMPLDIRNTYGEEFMQQILYTPYYHRGEGYPGPFENFNEISKEEKWNIPGYELHFKVPTVLHPDFDSDVQPDHAEMQMLTIRDRIKPDKWVGINYIFPTACKSFYNILLKDNCYGYEIGCTNFDRRADLDFITELGVNYIIGEDTRNIFNFLKAKYNYDTSNP